MKSEIHPEYYNEATVVCSCGETFVTGATQPELRVEICSSCHPFFTGEQRYVDTAGRVDKFKRRAALQAERAAKAEKADSADKPQSE